MSVLALVTARAGSKGVPGKNLKLLGGRPLIEWSFEAARKASRVDRTLLSSDDPAALELAKRHAIDAPFVRPAELASDTATHVAVLLHALDFLREQEGWQPDYLLLLQPTSPFRTADDIDRCLEMADQRQPPAIVSVTPASEHPLLMKTLGPESRLEPYQAVPTQTRRQDLPPLYVPNGALYCIRPEVLRREQTMYPEGALGFVMPAERSLDIDTPWQFEMADLWAARVRR